MNVNQLKILENIPAYVFLIDRNEKICYINKVASAVTKEEIIGMSLSTIFMQDSEYSKVSKALSSVFETGKSEQLDIHLQNPRWSELWFTCHLIPYPNEEGEVDYVLGIDYDNSRLIKAKHEAEVNEKKFKTIIEGTPTNVILLDENYNITFYNRTKSFPDRGNFIMGTSAFNYMRKEDKPKMKKIYERVKATGEMEEFEVGGMDPETGFKWYKGSCGKIDMGENQIRLIIQLYNITTKRMEELQMKEFNKKLEELVEERTAELQKANQEIRVLLKEMHHRVKNNLQIVSSLISFQSNYVPEELRPVLLKSKERIQSISVIHEMLYKNELLSQINIDEYLKALVNNHLAFFDEGSKVYYTIDTQLPNRIFDVETLVPIGLLINELVTNSIKHAFKDIPTPKIQITLSSDSEENIHLSYTDNGVGMDIDEHKESLGKELIHCFVEQLDGTMEVIPEKKGVHYEFVFSII